MNAKEFGQYLRSLRKKQKKTLEQLKKETGLSQPFLSQLENGNKGIPTLETLKKLAVPLQESPINLMINAGYIDLVEDFAKSTSDILKSENLFVGRRKDASIVHMTTIIFEKIEELSNMPENNEYSKKFFINFNLHLKKYLDDESYNIEQVINFFIAETESEEMQRLGRDFFGKITTAYMMLEVLKELDYKEMKIRGLQTNLEDFKDIEFYLKNTEVFYSGLVLSDEDKKRLLDMLPILFSAHYFVDKHL